VQVPCREAAERLPEGIRFMQELIIHTAGLVDDTPVAYTVPQYHCAALETASSGQNLTVSFTVTRLDTEILLRGTITGTITVGCSRCLEEYACPITVSFAQAYPSTDDSIDVEEEVRQVLLLSLPEKPLCTETCAGLCPDCGKNRNTVSCTCAADKPADLRWQKLQDFIKKS
jgi:uncharacterized protein